MTESFGMSAKEWIKARRKQIALNRLASLEITRLCAEAEGMTIPMLRWEEGGYVLCIGNFVGRRCRYNPLHDDAQAMALVKKFNMRIHEPSQDHWRAAIPNPQIGLDYTSDEQDLNKAICLCVAQMQKAKEPA